MLLQRARVARGGGDRERAAGERRRALAPHQRQQAQGVLEQVVAAGDGREVPAVELVLAPEPRRPEPAERPATRQHVERGDDLRQVGHVAVRDAVDQRAEPRRRRGGGEEPERGRALGHVLPLAPDRRDLHDVVHHRDRREADLLGGPGDGAEAAGELGRSAGPLEAADLQAEAERHRVLLLAPGVRRCVVQRAGHHHDVAVRRPVHAVEALVAGGVELVERGDQRAQLAGHDGRRDGLGPGPVAGAHLPLGRVDDDDVARHAGGVGEAAEAGADVPVEGGGVDDREQPAPQALGDDQLEHLGGVLRRPQVVAVTSDDGAQVVRRHDRGRREPAPRPRRLAGAGDADEHHEARVGEAHDGHTSLLHLRAGPGHPLGSL